MDKWNVANWFNLKHNLKITREKLNMILTTKSYFAIFFIRFRTLL